MGNMNLEVIPDVKRTDLVIGLTYAVGTREDIVIGMLGEKLKEFKYHVHVIKISEMIVSKGGKTSDSSYQKISQLMDTGNTMRRASGEYGILALAAIELILRTRDQTGDGESPPDGEDSFGNAFIVSSLKHPREADILREIYSSSFFLVAINENEEQRCINLTERRNMGLDDARKLVKRDEGEDEPFGQHTRAVFEMADIHLSLNLTSSSEKVKTKNEGLLKEQVDLQVSRVLDLIFANPFITPTFDEYAMFMAYASSLRSADLSRQIGAVITNSLQEIIATGANEVARFGGGQYWPDPENFKDEDGGRDYTRGGDANRAERSQIIDEIVNIFNFEGHEDEKEQVRQSLTQSRIKFLTEYSRPVHAEMSAIIACARSGISLNGATLYCSTFPCHNCAKHIINAGITRVVFIEPYPKSKTIELYSDSASITHEEKKVSFEEFVGIGPRKFFDLFSLKLSSGRSIIRQDSRGIVHWERASARLRCPLVASYTDREKLKVIQLNQLWKKVEEAM